ncbi:MFS transporter [Microbacterium thalassium]|uniref:MFS family permease n=1 Tax=Microbacterium thalassium TaxID=362649 RepID=A0A7X0FQE6_9MICO|nr:MFS transporter [Microbacterium thalassium]MBB6391763.1 MFS family permease [Microbacterium thalassium]GLK24365.1 MFS transporter [Microbacterium thalassium]
MNTSSGSGIWSSRTVGVTVGAIALIFLAALESLAVTTVMPVVAAELDGAALYAVAFSGTFAASVIGMVASGAWCDRASPLGPLATAVGLFVLGLIVAGIATSMPVLVIGRLLQGLGAGGQTVALYVVVARVYPAAQHGRVFAAFAAAWVIPSLIGPVLAGAVAEFLHWRWVFLGVAVLTLAAFALVWVRLRTMQLATEHPEPARVGARLVWAVVVAVAALALSLAHEAGPWTPVVVAVAAVAIAVAIRPLVPRGTLGAARGLPSVVLMRGMVAGALFGAEVYLPYLLIAEYGLSPVWAGAGLTAAALLWATGSAVQGRWGDALGSTRIAIVGIALLASATAIATATAAWHGLPAVLVAGWALAGAGMGLMYPRLSVLTLSFSSPQNQGFNSSALSISEAVGAASVTALLGVAFAAVGGGAAAFATVFALATAVAVAALVPGLRLGMVADGAHLPR